MVTFADLNLNKLLLNAIADLEYQYPTPIQKEAFPIVMSGRDVVGIAQTGTGKTFAYLLPLLRSLQFSQENNPRILILVPTRDLVIHVVGEVAHLTNYMTVRVGGAYGGTNIKTQKKQLQQGIDVLVATPGRLLDLALTRVLNVRFIKKLVIDEVDEMLNLGFRTQLNSILDILPNRRQSLLFSATMTEEVEALIYDFFIQPVKIEIVPTGTPLEQIKQSAYHVPNFNTKINLLKLLLDQNPEMDKVLVFISTKRLADLVYERLEGEEDENIGIIHSNKSQNQRNNTIKFFREDDLRVVIATDIIARGIDIDGVSHVVNFDLPEVPENYMHRIGRTGRADLEGNSIAFIDEIEQEFQMKIEGLMKKVIPLLELPMDLTISNEKLPFEIPKKGGDKGYLPAHTLKKGKGAFHEKKLKNQKVNLAHEKRKARKAALKAKNPKFKR